MAIPAGVDKLAFKVEWVDPHAQLKRHYLLHYYISKSGNQLELFDLKNHRVFLRKCPYPSVTLDDLFVGGKITIYARMMSIIDFGDDVTRKAMTPVVARSFGLCTAAAIGELGRVIMAANAAGLTVSKMKMVNLSSADARELGASSSGRVVGFEVVGPSAPDVWASVSSGFSGVTAVDDVASDRFFGPDCIESARSNTARVADCTLCIIKPHIVLKKKIGEVLDAVLSDSGLSLSAVQMFDIDMTAAEEFLEVYKGVVKEFHEDAVQLAGGRFLVVELVGEHAVNRFREVVGPHDPEMARKVRPDSLRARFGIDRVHNALHATDLDEDGELESEYFFRILG